MKKVPYCKAPGLDMHLGKSFGPDLCPANQIKTHLKASDWKTKLPFPSNINL